VRSISIVVAAACLALLGGATSAAAESQTTWPVDPPIQTGMANPGIVHTGDNWVSVTTGSWDRAGLIRTATELKGHWTSTGRAFLTRRPAWMNATDKSVWAPSIVQAADGSYRVFYAGLVAGESHFRCIGTGHSPDPRGPFEPYDRALSCYSGSGANAYDTIPPEGAGLEIIDATPAWAGSTLVLTYKTGHKLPSGDWHTTTRMVRLDPAQPQRTLPNPRDPDGGSIKITDSVHRYIEENPVLVKRGDRFTLFTSFGWYGTCDYWTRYRQNTSLWWGWLDNGPTALDFPNAMNTCGTGNAHVTPGLAEDSWRIVFNGHPDQDTSGGPDGLYVGVIEWNDGRPRVPFLLGG
jgi:hypothetical protein